MNYLIKMINSDQFIISEQTFKGLSNKSGLIFVKELNGIINLASVASIIPITIETARESNLRQVREAEARTKIAVDKVKKKLKLNY